MIISLFLIPRISAAQITAPDLEMPGKIAIDWKMPNTKAILLVKSNLKVLVRIVAEISQTPLIKRAFSTKPILKYDSTSNTKAKTIAGIVARTNLVRFFEWKKSEGCFLEKNDDR